MIRLVVRSLSGISLIICLCFLYSCADKKLITETLPGNQSIAPPAFPGAEGFGKYATGGRGGKVLIVSNLRDNGAGSFREALKSTTPRIIVFNISGTIHLTSPLIITSNVTIAGQTAPGDGICIADHPVIMKGNNIIVRFMRFRMGDRYQNKGMVHGSGSDDAFSGTGNRNVIIDHCSMSWSTDEVCSVYAGDSVTLQWNFISEPLNYSYHFETGDSDFEQHGFGGIIGGAHTSFHHNLYAHCVSRTPRFDGRRNIAVEFVDFRNNVIYNWKSNNVYAGEGGSYNLVNNYYKYGPSTANSVKSRVLNPYKRVPDLGYGKFFLEGNYIRGSEAVTKDNWLGVVMNQGSAADIPAAKMVAAFAAEAVKTSSAVVAYEEVLTSAGAIFPKRDSLDVRIVSDVRSGTGSIIDVQGGYPHGTDYEISKQAWPVLKTVTATTDSDKDGMPDDYEKSHGLNPSDPADAPVLNKTSGYANIEHYINSLVK
jgi:pectate lyase